MEVIKYMKGKHIELEILEGYNIFYLCAWTIDDDLGGACFRSRIDAYALAEEIAQFDKVYAEEKKDTAMKIKKLMEKYGSKFKSGANNCYERYRQQYQIRVGGNYDPRWAYSHVSLFLCLRLALLHQPVPGAAP